MASDSSLEAAVRTAILASAHVAAYDRVGAAAQACARLGALGSGRWRAAARDLDTIESDLLRAMGDAGKEVDRVAARVGAEAEALWTAGDAAATLDLLRELAVELLGTEPADVAALRVLQGEALLGVSFDDSPDEPDRGTTLVFTWAAPLAPIAWEWEATWIEPAESDGVGAEEVDLIEVSPPEFGDAVRDDFARSVDLDPTLAAEALVTVASALTRVSLLLGAGLLEEEPGEQSEDAFPPEP